MITYKKYVLTCLIVSMIFFLFPCETFPCSAFTLKKDGKIVCGKSEAFESGQSLLSINPRGVSKKGIRLGKYAVPEWNSKYGSVTFNTISVGMPFGGINEKGLVMETLWLNSSKYPDVGSHPALNELQIIQYVLDNCSTIEEAKTKLETIRVASIKAPVHYFLADAKGNSAVLEYVNGKMFFFAGKDLPLPITTNETYPKSLEYLKNYEEFGGKEKLPISMDRLDRFARLAIFMKRSTENRHDPAVAYAFDMLCSVTQKRWQYKVVYDISELKIYFNSRSNYEMKELSLKEVDFSCSAGRRVFNINENVKGNILASFKAYDTVKNKTLVGAVFSEVSFLKAIPAKVKSVFVNYPATVKCVAN